eukprot:1304069-Alexandrium_andersonii.AAC.1
MRSAHVQDQARTALMPLRPAHPPTAVQRSHSDQPEPTPSTTGMSGHALSFADPCLPSTHQLPS